MTRVFKTILECYMRDSYIDHTDRDIQWDDPLYFIDIQDMDFGSLVNAQLANIRCQKINCMNFVIIAYNL